MDEYEKSKIFRFGENLAVMRVCFRVDGGARIGLGHIMRSVALANSMRRLCDVLFVCRSSESEPEKYSAGINILKKNGMPVLLVPEDKVLDALASVPADMIITDSYDADEFYFSTIKKYFSISGCFDDEVSCGFFDVDFLINQNPYARQLKYHVNYDTKMLLGMEYLILRDEFRIRKEKLIAKKIQRIMITVGGSDDANITEEIISNLIPYNFELHVIIGSAFRHVDRLKSFVGESIHLCFNANMRFYMELCDVVITSCGITAYEVASMGTPALGLSIVENQNMAADTLDCLGIIKKTTISNLSQDVIAMDYNVRRKMSKIATSSIDGNGIDRVTEVLLKILSRKGMSGF